MASFDREGAKAAGYSDAEIDAYLRGGTELTTPAPSDATKRALPINARPLRDPREQALELLPTLGGMAGGIMGGAGGTVAGMGVGGIPGASAGAAMGGMGGEALRQIGEHFINLAAQNGYGEPIMSSQTPGEAMRRIGSEGAIQGGAELVGSGIVLPAVKAGAKALYRGALNASMKTTQQAAKTASRIAGQSVEPEAANLAEQGLSERVPLGRGVKGLPYSESGAERMAAVNAPFKASLDEAGAAAMRGRHPWTTNIKQLAPAITQLKAELRGSTNAARDMAQVDRWWAEDIEQFTEAAKPGKRSGARKMMKIDHDNLSELKTKWQKEADYNTASPTERQQLKQRYAKAKARAAREALESIQTPIRRTGQDAGSAIRAANEGLASRKGLGDAVSRAELRMASGARSHSAQEAVAPLAGGALGYAFGHGPAGGALGATAGLTVDQLLRNPALASRLALAMTEQGVSGPFGAMRQLPRAANYGLAPGGYYDPNQ